MKFVLKKKNFLKPKKIYILYIKKSQKEKKKEKKKQCGLYTIIWVSFLTMCNFFFLKTSGTPIYNCQLMLNFCLKDTICQKRKNVLIFAWVPI